MSNPDDFFFFAKFGPGVPSEIIQNGIDGAAQVEEIQFDLVRAWKRGHLTRFELEQSFEELNQHGTPEAGERISRHLRELEGS